METWSALYSALTSVLRGAEFNKDTGMMGIFKFSVKQKGFWRNGEVKHFKSQRQVIDRLYTSTNADR